MKCWRRVRVNISDTRETVETATVAVIHSHSHSHNNAIATITAPAIVLTTAVT